MFSTSHQQKYYWHTWRSKHDTPITYHILRYNYSFWTSRSMKWIAVRVEWMTQVSWNQWIRFWVSLQIYLNQSFSVVISILGFYRNNMLLSESSLWTQARHSNKLQKNQPWSVKLETTVLIIIYIKSFEEECLWVYFHVALKEKFFITLPNACSYIRSLLAPRPILNEIIW